MLAPGGHMRRARSALILTVLFGLMRPAPAHAWWDWLDELSGPGKFKGWHLEARLVCFTERVSTQTPTETQSQSQSQTQTPAPAPTQTPTRASGANETKGDLVDQN